MAKSFYFASTPYHLILCCAIEYQKSKPGRSHLLFMPKYDTNNIIKHIPNKEYLFSNVKYIDPKYHKNKIIRPLNRGLQSYQEALRTKISKPDEVYVYNDSTPTGQAIINNAPKKSKRVCIEDGTAAYASNKMNILSKRQVNLRKPLYGPWWNPNKVYGTHPRTSFVAAVFPELIRPELHKKKVIKIDNDYINTFGEEWGRSLLNKTLNQQWKKIETLVILDHPSIIRKYKNYQKLIRDIVEVHSTKEGIIAVKHHPRDNKNKRLLFNQSGLLNIPKSIPTELVISAAPNLTTIIGTTSTGLLSAKWINTNNTVISLAERLKFESDRILNVLKEIGVKMY